MATKKRATKKAKKGKTLRRVKKLEATKALATTYNIGTGTTS
jgi:hypothetical protein